MARRIDPITGERIPTKEELLMREGKKFYTFAFPIAAYSIWADAITARGEKPSDRLWSMIIEDMKKGQ